MIQIGKNLIQLSSVSSTNTYAAEFVQKERPEEGTVIMTEYQENGRGQRETSWESEKGLNLLASFIFYPTINVTDHFLFNQCIALGLHEMIRSELGNNVTIKWPNDILVNEKKIAGILIETAISGNKFQYAISGIGINLNQQYFKKYSPEATSFFLETEKLFMINDILSKLCICLSKWYNILNERNFDLIRIFYLSKLYRKDELSLFVISDEKIRATIKGIDENGNLLLEKKDGEILKINFKEMKYVF
jgi:BirA family biotin operon repressor/biotin-[acetyl-CoA-carboxylase] ligase